jgi:MtN3 and saliva related transmembrane protein
VSVLVLVVLLTQMPAVVPATLAIVSGVFTTIPQLLESLSRRRDGKISEVSVPTLLLLLTGQVLWLTYGLARPDVPIIITNLFAITVTMSLITVESRPVRV